MLWPSPVLSSSRHLQFSKPVPVWCWPDKGIPEGLTFLLFIMILFFPPSSSSAPTESHIRIWPPSPNERPPHSNKFPNTFSPLNAVTPVQSDLENRHMHVRWPNMVTGWSEVIRQICSITIPILLLLHQDVVDSQRHTNTGNSPACQNLNPSQLERRLRDEGDFDHRYMAADLEGAVDKFSDLADAKFMRRAEVYTCDSQCQVRTEQIRSTFAKYGQMPTGDSGPNPSFADVREVLEGHVGQVPSDGLWSQGSLFPNFAGPGQSTDPAPPPPAPALLPPFPPLPIDSGFPLAPPAFGSQTKVITVPSIPDYDDQPPKTPRPKGRRTKNPQGGFKWLTPGDLVVEPALDDSSDQNQMTTTRNPRRNNRRHPRSAPVNSTSIGQGLKIRCSKKGEEEQSGLHLLCGSCRIIRELPAEYFPRYLNEVSCSGQTCFDKSSSGGGRCVEQLLNFDILRNVGTSDCQKWTTYTVAVPVCCSCLMSSALAQFLTMPWAGQSLATSGPVGPGRPR